MDVCRSATINVRVTRLFFFARLFGNAERLSDSQAKRDASQRVSQSGVVGASGPRQAHVARSLPYPAALSVPM